jgi:hypothetical protein
LTLLAHQLVKRSTLPKAARPWFDDTTGVLGLLDEIQCFEVIVVLEAVMALLAGQQYVDPELPPEWAAKWQESALPR